MRADLDARSESIGRRIREAELQKILHMLVVGDREVEAGSVAVRQHGEGDLGSEPVDAFARRARRAASDWLHCPALKTLVHNGRF
ncbi:MAG: His/Gly/Thr/Pro-type tRNA ligase C-terminal domain-containing protein [Solirubrobacteraceae bacterium]